LVKSIILFFRKPRQINMIYPESFHWKMLFYTLHTTFRSTPNKPEVFCKIVINFLICHFFCLTCETIDIAQDYKNSTSGSSFDCGNVQWLHTRSTFLQTQM
jgi:hypothetical protein